MSYTPKCKRVAEVSTIEMPFPTYYIYINKRHKRKADVFSEAKIISSLHYLFDMAIDGWVVHPHRFHCACKSAHCLNSEAPVRQAPKDNSIESPLSIQDGISPQKREKFATYHQIGKP